MTLPRRHFLTLGTGAAAVAAVAAWPEPAAAVAEAGAGHGAGRYRWRNVEIVGGGFVTGIVHHPKQRGLVYARTDIGGAARLDPRTRRWVQLLEWVSFADWSLTGVESLALDPQDPSRLYLAVGTYTNEWSPINGAILRSTNQGRTFRRTDLPFKLGGNEPGRSMGERLAVDPCDGRVLYFGTRNQGLWRSTDRGETWARVDSFPTAGTAGLGLGFVFFDPRGSRRGRPTRTIYVGSTDRANPIWRSDDSGLTWSPLANQPTGWLPHHAEPASDGQLYVTYGDLPGPYEMYDGGVHKLDLATGVWTDITPLRPNTGGEAGFGYAGLAIDPRRPGTVMVATMSRWGPVDDVFRTVDGGATWHSIGAKIVLDTSGAPYLDFHGTPKLGWMIGDISIDPFDSDKVLYVTGATIFGTDDVTNAEAGRSTHWSVRAQGLEETAVLDLISPPWGPPLISALGDIGVFRHDRLDVVPPDGQAANPVSGSSPSLDYAARTEGFVVRVAYGDSLQRGAYSTDAGKSWQPFAGEPAGSTQPGKIVVSTDARTILWVPGDVPPHYSRDRGASWTPVTGLPQQVVVAADRVHPSLFFAFDAGSGTAYRSLDGGRSFLPTATGLPVGAGKLETVLERSGQCWLAAGPAGLFRSVDHGLRYQRLTTIEEALTVGFGKAAPGRHEMAVYTSGTVNGVPGIYRSDDSGVSWRRVNDDRHQYASTNDAIAGDPRVYGRVYLSTNGLGIPYGEPV
ncbi:carbohydrate-binding protein [Kribbella sp. ALI-6-A]|uniref:WD40/YVTN/BNR-like repeat-containing protein n=1 Tax=Kribbella sp. ALI-6-A TaxID=1933817 RepID=UPI00097CAB2C|nr:carbohydrate-binding protein [Kribbella sp. ALI-6-A]ONI75680.1 carbohydrate-binding protein [Kribbella sp. ALI-6-A]